MAAISLLGKKCQWFKAEVGLDLSSTPIEYAFCRYAVASGEPLIVEDATLDERFVENPLVTAHPRIRAYAGAPLLLDDGSAIGTVCVLDTKSRAFSKHEIDGLSVLARQVVLQLQVESLIERQVHNVTGLKKLRRELNDLASTDVLAGLFNRRGFVRELDGFLGGRRARATKRPSAKPTTLLCIDIDDFKAVNDLHGHDIGDRVLSLLGTRIREALGSDDFAARIGTDIFAVAMADEDAVSSTARLEKFLALVSQPVAVSGALVHLAVSAGYTGVEADAGGAAALLDRTDRAIGRAKELGGAQLCEWSREISEVLHHDRSLRAFVRSTLRSDDVCVFFQPVIDLQSGRLVRREALLRWSSIGPSGTNPASFVATAEAIGLIKEVGRLVLEQSCRALARWSTTEPGVGVAVNVSPLQIDTDLVDDVAAALRSHRLDPSLLTLEITENALFDRSVGGVAVLQDLHQMGVRISIDDFGSGYSSMSMLCDLPIDEVKIDRQFCSGNDPQLMMVAGAAIDLGHSLGLQVVAEGIETLEVLDSLINLGCEAGQGFLFGKPSPLTRT